MHASELRQLRHELGLSQSQLAEKMGVTRSTVSRWEMKTGKFPVSHMAANLVRLLAEKPLDTPRQTHRKDHYALPS